jgi:hypothetical protein
MEDFKDFPVLFGKFLLMRSRPPQLASGKRDFKLREGRDEFRAFRVGRDVDKTLV